MEEFVDNLSIIDPDTHHFDENLNFQPPHSINSFNSKQDIDTNSLKIAHHNARSLMKTDRIDEYQILLQDLKNPFDILIFTETWLTPDKKDLCNFEGFQSIHLIRPTDNHIDFKERGGGISIFIRDNLTYKHRDDLTVMLPYIECSFIEMKYNNQKYLIGGMYRIPNTPTDLFIEKLNKIIEPLKSSHKIILLGDFNIDLFKDDTHKQNFELCLQSNYLIPTILDATRVASKIVNNQEIITETLIDNILIKYNMNYQSGIIKTSITDHYTIYIIIPEISKQPNEKFITQYRLHNEHCQNKFNNLLNNSDIRLVLKNQIGESAFPQFINTFQDHYDKAFPIKTKKKTLKNIQKPWVTGDLLKKIRIRDKLSTLAKKKKIDRKAYTDYRNLLTTELRKKKAKYFEDQFETNANNTKKTWEVINGVIKQKKPKTNVLISDDHGNYIEEPNIPSEFIDHITSITDTLASNIPPSIHNAEHYLKNRVNQSFRAYQIEPGEVNSIIDDLKNSGNNVNCIATAALVGSKHIITPIICHLINLFVQQGYFPDELKLGCITPIYKNGDKEKVNNYRPICSLSPFSKIIEKVINNRMLAFLDKYNILSKTQFGFRKKMGTETALLNYIDNLQQELNNKKYSISVFLDLSKAFDVIDHTILKKKLEHYGFRGKFLEFLLNSIKNRK